MFDLIAIGDSTYDIFIKPHEAEILRSSGKVSLRIPYEKLLCFAHGDKIEVENVSYSLGGSACNVASGIARLGLRSGLCSFCGDDEVGEKIRKMIGEEKIELVSFVTDKKIHSTYSFIIRHKGDRTILVYRDKFDYKKIKIKNIKKTKWIYLSSLGRGYEKDVIKLVAEKNILMAINPGKNQLKKKSSDFLLLLKMAEIVFVNKQEAELFLGARFPLQINEIYRRIAEYGVKNFVITDGLKGSYVKVGKEIVHQVAYKSNILEVTGAGDAFASGFLGSYIRDFNLKKGLLWGAVNGSKVVEKIGAQNGILNIGDMKKACAKLD